MAAQPPRGLFEAADPADQLLQPLAKLLLLLATLLPVGIHRGQQTIQARLDHLFQARQIGGLAHAVLQSADLLA